MARNGDGLHKRGDIWHFKYQGPDGRYHEKSTGQNKQSEARKVRDRELDLIRQGQFPSDMGAWTLEMALSDWIQFREATRARTTLPPEKSAVRHLQTILGAKRRLESITSADIRRYQATRRKTVGPKTVNNEVLVLIGVLKQAKLWKRLQEDYKPLSVPKHGPGTALTPEQAAHLIRTAMRKPAWEVALCATVLAYATGCRSWEIKGLKLKDIHLEGSAPFIRIRRETTKTDAGARDVALNELAVWAVRRLWKRAEAIGASDPEDYLLPANLSKHTRPTDPLHGQSGFDVTQHQRSWASAWRHLRAAAGLRGFRFHDLRHSCITQSIQAGVPIEVMMAQVGHVAAEMTRYYTHLGTGAKHAAAKKMDEQNPMLQEVLGMLVPAAPLN